MEITNTTSGKCRVALYIRVSTEDQSSEGYGQEAQRHTLEKYIKQHEDQGYVTKREWVFQDTISGSEVVRPQLEKLLKLVREEKIDTVIVAKIDRLSRNLKHLLDLFDVFEKHKVGFVSVQENIDFRGPIGKLIFQIFGAIAQFERELIKGRTRSGKIASARMGNYIGTSIPYGYREVKDKSKKFRRLEILPEEKKWVEKIFDWYVDEGLGDVKIAKKLNALGVPRPSKIPVKRGKGKVGWTARIVEKIVENSLYAGEHVAVSRDDNGNPLPPEEYVTVSVPPCVTRMAFAMAQEARALKIYKGGGGNRDYLLSGLLRDMSFSPSRGFVGATRSDGKACYRRKQFKDPVTGKVHKILEIPAKQLEDHIWKKITEAVRDPEGFIERYVRESKTPKSKAQAQEQELASLKKKVAQSEVVLERVHAAYEAGSTSLDKYQERLALINTEKERTLMEIQAIERDIALQASLDLEIAQLKTIGDKFKRKLGAVGFKQKRLLMRVFIDRVELSKTLENGSPKIVSKVLFRFNPNDVRQVLERGRTQRRLKEGQKGTFGLKNSQSGDPGGI